MSIRVLTIDLKSQITTALAEVRGEFAKNWSPSYGPQVFSEDSVPNLREWKRCLEDRELWQDTDKNPIEIIINGREKISSSKGTLDLFGIKVKATKAVSAYYYVFKNMLFEATGPYNVEEAALLVKDYYNKRRAKIDSLNESAVTPEARTRGVIPEAVRHEVWRRDQGKCVECGSQDNLEFDHLIPFSRGGANTVRNLQLLCEKCNRKKSAKI